MLEGKSAIVIGASRGIGAATAAAFVDNGAKVVLVARDIARLEELAEGFRKDGGEALAFQADVTDAGAIEAAVDFTVRSFGRLDVALNNAAANPSRAPLGDYPLDEFDSVIATNLRSVFVAMKAEINAMLASGGGSIINTSSSAGLIGMPMMPAYMASKHGVVGLTKGAALEYAKKNIRINAIAPGAVLTEMLMAGSGGTPEGRAKIASMTPMGRIGEPSELAEAAVWLASDRASFVTGVTLPVDGGYVIP